MQCDIAVLAGMSNADVWMVAMISTLAAVCIGLCGGLCYFMKRTQNIETYLTQQYA